MSVSSPRSAAAKPAARRPARKAGKAEHARETQADAGAPPESTASSANPSKRRKSGRSETTRRRLLDAGRTLFAAHGPQAVTSHAIAAEAGFASGTFYLHFQDKVEVFRELAEEAAREMERRVIAADLGADDRVASVTAQGNALVDFAEEHRDLLRILFHPGGDAGDTAARVLELLAKGFSARRRERSAEDRAPDTCFEPDILAQAVVGMWAHVLGWWAEDPSRASREDLVRTLTHFQIHGNCCDTAPGCDFEDGPALPLSNSGAPTPVARAPHESGQSKPTRP